MNPVSVLQLAKSMGPVSGKVLLVGCEPATLGGEEGQMGLSEAVAAVVDQAKGDWLAKAGVKPVLGCEVYVVDDHAARPQREKRAHLTLLAEKIGRAHV